MNLKFWWEAGKCEATYKDVVDQLQSFAETSFILRLSKLLTESRDENVAVPLVVDHALNLLLKIHNEICDRDSAPVEKRLENPGERRTIFALLDLLVLEGIYPSLTFGIGVPIQRRAGSFVLPNQITPPDPSARIEVIGIDRKEVLLVNVIQFFVGIVENSSRVTIYRDFKSGKSVQGYRGIEGMLRERCLVDLLAGCGELAFNPTRNVSCRNTWRDKFNNITSSINTAELLPLLLGLLHPTAPPWFRVPVAEFLSQLPVSRPNGIRNILELFLSKAPPGSTASTASPQLSVDALSNASRLISSVPKSMSPRVYFSKICPQLLEVLRSNDPGLERAAAYVIAELLGKKGAEVEDTIEREIVRKIISCFDPSILAVSSLAPTKTNTIAQNSKESSSLLLELEDKSSSERLGSPLVVEMLEESEDSSSVSSNKTLVSDTSLSMACRDLEILLSSHPTLLLPHRLVSPIVIPLWGLMGYAKSTGRSLWHSRIFAILKSYLAVSLDQSVLKKLQRNLVFTRSSGWEYAPGSTGGIAIQSASRIGIAELNMHLIDSRVEDFLKFLGDSNVLSGTLNEYFLNTFRSWLARSDEDPLDMLIIVKILQKMLENHVDALGKKPTEILQIVKSVLDEYVGYMESISYDNGKSNTQNSAPSLLSLKNIVDLSEANTDTGEEGFNESHRTETVVMALTLLTVLVSSPETKLTESDERLISTLQPALHHLSTLKIDPVLNSQVSNITSFLSLKASASSTTARTSTINPSTTELQGEKYNTALSYLHDPLIPVRGHGLHLLRELILDRAPIVDITNICRLLITMLKDADSFVYLNVVKCLTALTDRHSSMVTDMLVGAYSGDGDVLGIKGDEGDENSEVGLGLDERLKIGEALLGTVQRLGKALVGQVSETVVEGMVTIISRRRVRRATEPTQRNEIREEILDLDIDPATGQKLTAIQISERNHHSHIVLGWSTTPHEDLRIRTSALSILGVALQTNPIGLSPFLAESLSISLSILTQETSAEAGILRRAAVKCVSAVLLDVVRDEEDGEGVVWRNDVWRVVNGRVEELRRVLGYVCCTDCDGLVREMAKDVGESLEGLVERRVRMMVI